MWMPRKTVRLPAPASGGWGAGMALTAAKRDGKRRGGPMKTNVVTLVAIVIGVVLFLWHALSLPMTPMRVAGLALVIPAFTLLLVARMQLGAAFSLEARASELVTTGIYSRIRNPIYFFGGLMIAGVILWTQRPLGLLVLAVLIPLQIMRVRKEEQVLEAKFGAAYLEYKRKTWF
jgi:protein-S-isoprenylcysteine O-methyltransferase Ste14